MQYHQISWLFFISISITTNVFLASSLSVSDESTTRSFFKIPDFKTYLSETEKFVKTAAKVAAAEVKNKLSGAAASAETCTINKRVKAATEEEAYVFGRFAAAAYCKAAQDIESWNCTGHCLHPTTRGMEDVTVVEKIFIGLKYYIGVNLEKKWLIVSFRGTIDQPVNIIMDLLIFPVAYNDLRPDLPKGAKIHFGFKKNYQTIRNELLTLLRYYWDSYPELNSVKLTGHSMGGALAELLALDIQGNEGVPSNQIQLFTYGAPRLGNIEYVRFFSSIGFNTVTRVTSNSDIVPLLPPRSFSFAHTGQELHLEGVFPNITSPTLLKNWSLNNLKRYFANYTLTVKRCNLTCVENEDEKCVLSHTKSWSSASHLQAWDIKFGTWC